MSLLNKLTIIALSYKRQDYVLRLMNFWSYKGPKVHIVDGSPQPLDLNKIKNIDKNIHYHHIPIYEYSDRFQIIGKFVTTPYVLMSSDDEFFIPSAVSDCIFELDKDSTLSTCMGRSMVISLYKETLFGRQNQLSISSIEDDNALDRVKKHFSTMLPVTYYAVTRSELLAYQLNAINHDLYKNPLTNKSDWLELQREISATYFGKNKVIDTLMWLRTEENPSLPFLKHTDNEANILYWYNRNDLSEDNKLRKSYIKKILSDTILLHKKENKETVKKIVETGLNEYVANVQARWKRNNINTIVTFKFVVNIFKKYISSSIKKRIRFFLKLNGEKLEKEIARLIQKGIKVDKEEIFKIKNTMIEFHKKLKKNN